MIYGYRNACYYNTRPAGDLWVYPSRKARDKARTDAVNRAVAGGLNSSSASSGHWNIDFRETAHGVGATRADCYRQLLQEAQTRDEFGGVWVREET